MVLSLSEVPLAPFLSLAALLACGFSSQRAPPGEVAAADDGGPAYDLRSHYANHARSALTSLLQEKWPNFPNSTNDVMFQSKDANLAQKRTENGVYVVHNKLSSWLAMQQPT